MAEALFAGYESHASYDEMFERSSEVRRHCLTLYDELRAASAGDLSERQREADRAFLTQGITFTVYGDEQGTERIFPFDLVPRLIPAVEWATLEAGLTQRLTAINLFLKDVYHQGRILSEGVVPRELVQSCRHFRREMRGVAVHGDIYVSVAGTDLVRGADGRFVVLEDNLRVPSGVSYILANREVTKRVLPRLFERHHVRPIAQYGQALLATLRALADRARADLRRAHPRRGQFGLLRARLSGAGDGGDVGRGPRPARHDNIVYMRTTAGLRGSTSSTGASTTTSSIRSPSAPIRISASPDC